MPIDPSRKTLCAFESHIGSSTLWVLHNTAQIQLIWRSAEEVINTKKYKFETATFSFKLMFRDGKRWMERVASPTPTIRKHIHPGLPWVIHTLNKYPTKSSARGCSIWSKGGCKSRSCEKTWVNQIKRLNSQTSKIKTRIMNPKLKITWLDPLLTFRWRNVF